MRKLSPLRARWIWIGVLIAAAGCSDSTAYVLSLSAAKNDPPDKFDLVTATVTPPDGASAPASPANLCVSLSTIVGALQCGAEPCTCGADAGTSKLVCLTVPSSSPRRVFVAYAPATGDGQDIVLGKLYRSSCDAISETSLISSDALQLNELPDGG